MIVSATGANPAPPKLLLVEDDETFAEELSTYLVAHSFEVHLSRSLEEAFESLSAHSPDVMILDQFLEAVDSLATIQQLRQRFSGGLMILTGNTEPADRIVGLELGADDYVSKLTTPREILARVRSLLRRPRHPAEQAKPSPPPAADQWRLDKTRRELFGPAGQIVHLTSSEFGTLRYLDDHRGQPVSRDDLSVAILRRRYDVFDRSIDNLVSRLRRKIEELDPNFRALKTLRGEGYVFLGFDKEDSE